MLVSGNARFNNSRDPLPCTAEKWQEKLAKRTSDRGFAADFRTARRT
jgi:hypothetical protein